MYSKWIAVHALTFWRNFRVCFSLIILNNIHNSTCTRACVQQQKNAKITLIFYKCTTIRVDPTPKMCVACLKMLISLSLKLKFVWALIFTFLSRILSENFCALLWFLQSTKAPHGPVICLLASADGIWIIKMKCILWIYWFCMHPPQITLKVFASVCFLLLFYSFVSFRIFFHFLKCFSFETNGIVCVCCFFSNEFVRVRVAFCYSPSSASIEKWNSVCAYNLEHILCSYVYEVYRHKQPILLECHQLWRYVILYVLACLSQIYFAHKSSVEEKAHAHILIVWHTFHCCWLFIEFVRREFFTLQAAEENEQNSKMKRLLFIDSFVVAASAADVDDDVDDGFFPRSLLLRV